MASPPGEAFVPCEPTEPAFENSISSESSESSVIESEFLERISEIPAVKIAKAYSSDVYGSVKNLNSLTAAAFSAFENTVSFIAIASRPVFDKLQPHVKSIDKLACEGLVIIERRVPYVLKPPEEIVGDTRKLITSTVETTVTTMDDIKKFGGQKINDALQETENLVDKYIPPASEEDLQEKSKAESLSRRATNIFTKAGLRLYGHATKHIKPIQDLGSEYAISMLQSLPLGLDQTLSSLFRNTTSSLGHVFHTAANSILSLPVRRQEVLQTARRYATEFYVQVDQATNVGQHTVNCLQIFRQKLAALEELIRRLKHEEIEMEILEKDEAFSESVSSPSSL